MRQAMSQVHPKWAMKHASRRQKPARHFETYFPLLVDRNENAYDSQRA